MYIVLGHGKFINNLQANKKLALDLNLDAKFLEHLADTEELDELLRITFSTLKPCGKLLIVGPNLRSLGNIGATMTIYWSFTFLLNGGFCAFWIFDTILY
jgi:hypothetical protein